MKHSSASVVASALISWLLYATIAAAESLTNKVANVSDGMQAVVR